MDAEKKVAQNAKTAKPKKRSLFKILLGVFVGLIVLLTVIVLVTPMVLSSAGGKAFLLGRINRSVDGQVGMETFSVGWLSGVKLTHLTYDSGDGATQVKVDRIETQPSYAALIGGRVDLGKTLIERPQVHLKVPSAQASGSSEKTTSPKPTTPSGFVLPVQLINLEVVDGNATIELQDDNHQTQRVAFKNIASKVVLNEPGQTSELNLSAQVADGQTTGSVRARGQVTPPKKGWTLEDTDGTFTVEIDKLQLESLRPLLALAGLDVQTGGELNADANVLIRKGIVETLTAEAVVQNFSQGIGEQKVVFSEPVTLTAKGGMKDKAVRIDTLDLKMPFCTVSCQGGLDTLTYDAKANLAQTQSFLKQFAALGAYSMAGSLNVSGQLKMTEGQVNTAGKGTVKDLLLSREETAAPKTDVTLDYDVAVDNTKGLLTISSASLKMLPGTVTVRNLSAPLEGAGPITLDAQAKLDMAKAWPYAQILGGAPQDMTLAGNLDAAFAVETKDDIMRIKTDKTTVQKLRVAKEGSKPFVQDEVKLTADVTLDLVRQSIGINTFDMQGSAGETLIKITKGKVEQSSSNGVKTLDAMMDAEYDWQAVSGLASPYLPEGLTVKGKRNDSFAFSSQWPENAPDKMLANLNGKANVGFDAAEYQGLKFGPTEMTVDVKQGRAAIDMPDADVNGGKVRFAGDINLAEKPMLLTLRKPAQVVENVSIDDIISAKLLQYINPAFAKANGVSGKANLSCSTLTLPLGGGNPQDINIAGNIGLTEVRLNSPLLGLFNTALRTEGLDLFSIPPTAFTVKDKTVQYTDMPMMFGKDFALLFSGIIGFDKSLQMDVKVPVDDRTYVVPLAGTLDKQKPDFGKLVIGNITEQIPIKDEKTREAVEQGLELFEGLFKKGEKK